MAKLRLREMLKKRRLTIKQFAELIPYRYTDVFRWLRPGYDPKLSMLEKWAKALSCRIRDLYEEE